MARVSVIMSVYNEEKYICESIESILNQTFVDYEFIIIDDASTDSTVSLIECYKDIRIKLIKNTINRGLTKNLNAGLKIAGGQYIIRMDGDDVAYPNRIAEQVDFMDHHREIKLASCGYRIIGSARKTVSCKVSCDEIRAMLIFNSVLPHPGFIFDRKAMNDVGIRYNERLKYAQDYDFQARVVKIYDLALMPQVLFDYRVSKKQISVAKFEQQQKCANYIRMKELQYLGINKMPIRPEVWRAFSRSEDRVFSLEEKYKVFVMTMRITNLCKGKKMYNEKAVKEVCTKKLQKFIKIM